MAGNAGAVRKTKKKRRSGRRFERRAPPGSAPGTIIVDPSAPAPSITALAFGPDNFWEGAIKDVAELERHLGEAPYIWVNVNGLGHLETIMELGRIFGLHRLSLEDVVNLHQRPKAESYDKILYVVLNCLTVGRPFLIEQVSCFLGPNFVLTFQEREGDPFDPIRERLRKNTGRIRHFGPDYLLYALIDTIIDNFFPVVEDFTLRTDALEVEVFGSHDIDLVRKIHRFKREATALNRIVRSHSSVVSELIRSPYEIFAKDTIIHLRDCQDHLLQLLDYSNSYRESASNLIDLFLSFSSHRSNEIMRFLTIVAAVFIPLTFIAGIYGMNFNPASSPFNMPELNWMYGYPFALLLMTAVAIGMLYIFYRNHWLGRPEPIEKVGRSALKREVDEERAGFAPQNAD